MSETRPPDDHDQGLLDARVSAVVKACLDIGDPAGFEPPPGYPGSLALCALDSIWSIGVRYSGVVAVINRWRTWARDNGFEPETAPGSALLRSIEVAGGPDRFAADVVCNEQRTSSRNGILKSAAVRDATTALVEIGIDTTDQLRRRATDDEVRRRWCGITGQRSGISWHYLLVLAGVEDIKPDRMVLRFVRRSLSDAPVTEAEAYDLVLEAYDHLRTAAPSLTLRALDHAIWSTERSRAVARLQPAYVDP